MLRFLIRRTVLGLITLWVVVTAVFILYFVAPNDPARLLAGRQATEPQVAAIRRSLGLADPIMTQYGHYLERLLHFDLGLSYKSHEAITTLIANAIPVDISLAIGGGIIWLTSGVGIGVLAARRPRSLADRSATVFALIGLSMPVFILGLLLLYVFFYLLTINGLKWFPPPGYVPLSEGILPWAHALILPWISLAFVTAATYSRLTRSSLLETLGEDYIRTARAKGLSERRVVYKHGLRSALTPIVTQFGIDIAGVLGGVILTETVFGLNGLGRTAVLSIDQQDLPLIMGIVIASSFFVIFANIVVDFLYAFLDPRVRLS